MKSIICILGENVFLEIYLDNSATTKPCKSAVEAASFMMNECFGNPSSLHKKGFDALNILENSRNVIAESLGTESPCIYFTPSGTTANNTAIFGAAELGKRKGNKIVTTSIEHPSVRKCMEALSKDGFDVVYLNPDESGNIDISQFQKAIDENTILVSVMAVNNEVGSILPFDKIKNIIKMNNSPALLHVDAVQGYMKIKIKPRSMGIDLLSMSAHKIHGIKGIGALFADKSVRIKPYILGGGQENNMVSGTQGMPAIAAFSAAVEAFGDTAKRLAQVEKLRDYFIEKVQTIDGVSINSPNNALPYIVNISLEKIPSQVSVNFFSMNGVYISAGSACSKGHRSDVLTAMGLSSQRIDNAIRISFSYENTMEEIDYCIEVINKALLQLRKK